MKIDLQEYKNINNKVDLLLNRNSQPKKVTKEMEFLQYIYPLVYRLRTRAEPLTYKEIITILELDMTVQELAYIYHKAEKRLINKKYTNLLVLTKQLVPSQIIDKSIETEYKFSVILKNTENLKFALKLDELGLIESTMGQLIAKRIMYWYHISDKDIIENNNAIDSVYEYLLNNANANFFELYNKTYDTIITSPRYL